jgi:hypothetical protein
MTRKPSEQNADKPTARGLYIDMEQTGGYLICKAEIVAEHDGPSPFRFLHSGDDSGLMNLAISGQANRGETYVYAWRLGFSERDITAERAEQMASILRKIERGLAKITTSLGEPESWPAYVLRVASVLGISLFYRKSSPRTRDVSGLDYAASDAAGALYYMRNALYELGQKEKVAC